VLLGEGLHHVYTGNISYSPGEVTYCSACHLALIERDRYELLGYRVAPDGCCPSCGTRLPGRYDAVPGHFGPRRILVSARRVAGFPRAVVKPALPTPNLVWECGFWHIPWETGQALGRLDGRGWIV